MSRYLRMGIAALGVFALLLGLVWIGRGMEWFVWPAGNFMAGQTMWAWRGLALAAMGCAVAFAGLRLGRR